jgi:hypothetical protein
MKGCTVSHTNLTAEVKPVAQHEVDEALRRVGELDLGPIAFLLVHEGSSVEDAERKLTAYRRFLALVLAYPHLALVPSQDADDALHAHIMDTELYMEHTKALFGQVMHHWPYLGRLDEEDKKRLERQGEVTRELFATHFNDVSPWDIHWCAYVTPINAAGIGNRGPENRERPRLAAEAVAA